MSLCDLSLPFLVVFNIVIKFINFIVFHKCYWEFFINSNNFGYFKHRFYKQSKLNEDMCLSPNLLTTSCTFFCCKLAMNCNGKGMMPCKTDNRQYRFSLFRVEFSKPVAVSKWDNSESFRFGGKRRDEYSQKTFQMLSLQDLNGNAPTQSSSKLLYGMMVFVMKPNLKLQIGLFLLSANHFKLNLWKKLQNDTKGAVRWRSWWKVDVSPFPFWQRLKDTSLGLKDYWKGVV